MAPLQKFIGIFAPISKSLRALTRAEKLKFFTLVGLRVVTNLIDLIGLGAIGVVVAMAAQPDPFAREFRIGSLLITAESDTVLLYFVGGVASVFVAKSMASALLAKRTARFLASTEARVATTLLESVSSAEAEVTRKYSSSDFHFVVGQSSHAGFANLLYAMSALVSEGTLLMAIVSFLLFVEVKITLFSLLYFFLLFIFFHFAVSKRAETLGARLHKNQVHITQRSLDLYAAIKELFVAGKISDFSSSLIRARSEVAMDYGLQRFTLQLPRYIVEAGLVFGMFLLVIAQYLTANAGTGYSTVAIFVAAGFRIMAASLPLQNALIEIKWAGPQAEPAQNLILDISSRAPNDSANGPALVQATRPNPSRSPARVVIRDLLFHYPDSDKQVLEHVNLELEPGTINALIGPSGAGKSTLVDLILGLDLPSHGEVKIDGNNVRDVLRRAPGYLAYLPQKPGLVSGSIADNIALGIAREDMDRSRIDEVLKLAELETVVAALDQGIFSPIGKQLDSLSGGQLQRLGLARALYSDPALLVLDEATSALDAETEDAIINMLSQLKHRCTILVIAHKISTVTSADKIFVLEQGRVNASGSFTEVRKQSRLVREYLRLSRVD